MVSVASLISANIDNTLTNYNTWGSLVFNVKSYGAKGDGINNDTAAIAAAMEAAKEVYGIVYFPPGVYLFAGPLYIDKRITIMGSGEGDDSTSGDSKAGTLLVKTNDAAGFIVTINQAILQDFTITSNNSSDTGSGIEIGGADNAEVGGATSILRVSSLHHGGDGIWLRNGNCCDLDVITSFNKGHGLRLESTTTGYDNTNANIVRMRNSLANVKSGLYIYKSSANVILMATCEANLRYGHEINAPNNTIFGYTEANTLGSALFGASAFGNFVISKYNEGDPTYTNGFNFVISRTSAGQTIKMMNLSTFRSMTTATASLNFGTINAGASSIKTIINVFGARVGDAVTCSPNGAIEDGIQLSPPWVSADDTVSVKLYNGTAGNIAVTTRTWRADVTTRSYP